METPPSPQYSEDRPRQRQPVFNVPTVVLAILGILLAVHVLMFEVLGGEHQRLVVFYFAFIPARFTAFARGMVVDGAIYWSAFSYSLLHANWTHLVVNSVWMLAFGSVVARRFGAGLFLVFCAVGSLGGAIAHFLANPESFVPMIGASAVVSACIGAAVRFAFPAGGRFSPAVYALPPQGLGEAIRNPQIVAFVAVWFGINLLFGLGGELIAGQGQSIAWQAHVGGFLVGLLGFGWFDRYSRFNRGFPR